MHIIQCEFLPMCMHPPSIIIIKVLLYIAKTVYIAAILFILYCIYTVKKKWAEHTKRGGIAHFLGRIAILIAA